MTPFAALLAPKGHEGAAVGLVLSGVLGGVLVSKVVAGLVTVGLGWRALYWGAAATMIGLALVLRAKLPKSRPARPPRYLDLLASSARLARDEPALRRHALYGGLTFASFMTFWVDLCDPSQPGFWVRGRDRGPFRHRRHRRRRRRLDRRPANRSGSVRLHLRLSRHLHDGGFWRASGRRVVGPGDYCWRAASRFWSGFVARGQPVVGVCAATGCARKNQRRLYERLFPRRRHRNRARHARLRGRRLAADLRAWRRLCGGELLIEKLLPLTAPQHAKALVP
jgi:hypothetical protein